MRAHEFDNKQSLINRFTRRADIVGRINSGEYVIFLHDHLILRQQERKVDEFIIKEVIPKIPHAKAKIKQLHNGQKFWMYDNTNDVAVGCQLISWPHKIILVRTVLGHRPRNDANYPIFDVA